MLTATPITDIVNQPIAAPSHQQAIKTVVFDAHVEDLNLLLDGLQPNVQALVLQQDRDGLEQITTFLQQNLTHDLTLITHGFPGGLRLGATTLELSNLNRYTQQLQQWFTTTGHLTLMACNVAQGKVGQTFIQRLSEATSADIIASAEVLGNGRWLPTANALFTPDTLTSYRGTFDWSVVGPGPNGADIANEFDIEVDSKGTPYIIFQDGSNDLKLTVKRFDGTNWVDVGTPGFPGPNASFAGIEFDSNDTPYIAFKDGANNGKASVMQFNGSAWTYVGNPGVSRGGLKDISFTIDGNTPYIAYTDRSQGSRATVRTFNGTAWVDVGQPGFSSGEIESADINVDGNGVPYIAYLSPDGSTNKVTVQRFVNGQWSVVGTEAFSLGAESYAPDIEFDNNNVPYVVYRARGNGEGNKAIVESFNGADWVQVGNSNASNAGGFHPDLEFDNNNVLHLAIVDQAKKDKVTVRVLEGDTWVNLSDSGFSIGPMNFPDLEFDANNIPYVLYRETFDDQGSTVKGAVVQRLGEPSNIVDAIAPVLTSIRRKTPTEATIEGGSVIFEAQFSEAVTNVGLEDFVINGLTTATIDSVNAIDNTRYEIAVSVTGDAVSGTLGLDLAASSDITDIVGNGLTLSEPAIDEVYTIPEPILVDPPPTNSEEVETPGNETQTPVVKQEPPTPPGETVVTKSSNKTPAGLLTVLPGGNTVETTTLGNDNTLQLTFLEGTFSNVTDVIVFGEGSTPDDIIGQFSLLDYSELPIDSAPRFTIDSDTVAAGGKFQFAIQDNGTTLFATSTKLSDSTVQLDFSNGFSFNAQLATETDTTNLLIDGAAAIDLTQQSGTSTFEFSVYREAAMDNTVDLYATDFADGGIIVDDVTGQTLRPGDEGYKEAAISNRLNLNLSGTNNQVNTVETSLTSGIYLGMFVVIDGVDPTVDDVVFSYSGANTDKNDHIKHLGDNTFGIEDQAALGDKDFDDIVVQFAVV